MPSEKSASKAMPKKGEKPKTAKPVLLERTGVLWAIDGDGGLQLLNGEESEATAVDYCGLYWNAKAGQQACTGLYMHARNV